MIQCRTHPGTWLEVHPGRQRGGKSKGRRVYLYAQNDLGDGISLSVYPEDARKFAMELLKVADQCSQ